MGARSLSSKRAGECSSLGEHHKKGPAHGGPWRMRVRQARTVAYSRVGFKRSVSPHLYRAEGIGTHWVASRQKYAIRRLFLPPPVGGTVDEEKADLPTLSEYFYTVRNPSRGVDAGGGLDGSRTDPNIALVWTNRCPARPLPSNKCPTGPKCILRGRTPLVEERDPSHAHS